MATVGIKDYKELIIVCCPFVGIMHNAVQRRRKRQSIISQSSQSDVVHRFALGLGVVWDACSGAREFIVDIVCRSLKRVVIDSDISSDSCDEQESDHGKVRRKDTGKGRKTSSPLPANSEPSSSPSVVQSRPVLSGSLSSPAASSRPRPASSAGRSTGTIPAATAALSSVSSLSGNNSQGDLYVNNVVVLCYVPVFENKK